MCAYCIRRAGRNRHAPVDLEESGWWPFWRLLEKGNVCLAGCGNVLMVGRWNVCLVELCEVLMVGQCKDVMAGCQILWIR